VRRLGALQLGDGLVALPHSARNLEHLQWLAADIAEHEGTATVWHARPDSARDHDALIAAMQSAIAAEYEAVVAEAGSASREERAEVATRRTVRRLRGELRRIGQRDHFGAPGGAIARAAVEELARSVEAIPA
jgi:hypothetical protein